MKYFLSIVLGVVLLCTIVFAGQLVHIVKNEPVVAEEATSMVKAPEALRLKIVPNGFQLNWTPSSHDEKSVTGYEIVRSDRFTGPYDQVEIVEKGTSQYIDTTAAPEIIYYYKVRAVAGTKYSTFSNIVSGER